MNRLLIAAVALAASASVAAAQRVKVSLTEWKIAMSTDTVHAGSVTFQVSNDGSMTHALHVHGAGMDKQTRDIGKGESATLTVTLKPGSYDVWCPESEGSHKLAGMKGTVVVLPAEAAPAKKKPGA